MYYYLIYFIFALGAKAHTTNAIERTNNNVLLLTREPDFNSKWHC